MVFSDTTNKNGAIQFIERLTKTGDGGITGNSTLFKQITASFNQGVNNVFAALLKADKNWKIDDSAYTDFPTAQIDLVSLTRDYLLPTATVGGDFSTLYRINKVRILDQNGDKIPLELFPVEEDINEEFYNQTGRPTHYRLHGKSIILFPTPITGQITTTDGLEIDFQRGPDPFDTNDTTKQPGFVDAFHDVPCYYASSECWMADNPNLATLHRNMYTQRLQELVSFKADMDDNAPGQITSEEISFR